MKFSKKTVIFSEKFKKQIAKFSPMEKERIKKKLLEIYAKEAITQVRKLKNYFGGQFRLKIGKYRILFDCKKGEILFLGIYDRRDLY